MKSFAVIAAVAGLTAAQTLSPCAQQCADNMARIANTQFMCGAGDISCFCTKSNWAFGLRDCTAQACGTVESGQATAWALAQCANAQPSLSALPILSSALASASGVIASVSARVSSAISAGQSNIAITTVPLVVVVTSGSNVMTTTTGFSTVYSGLTGVAASRASSVAASLQSGASGAIASASSVAASVESAASGALASVRSSASGAVESATNAIGSAASSAAAGVTSTGAAPQMTAFPAAAGAVGAGFAALLLL